MVEHKNLNILHIVSYYPWTSLYQALFDSLIKKKIGTSAYVFVDNSYGLKKEFPNYINVSKCFNKNDRYIFHLKHLKVLCDIENHYNIKEFNVIHAHSMFSNGYIAYIMNKKYKVPYIVAVRNTDVNLFFKRLFYLRRLGIKILKNASKVIFLSDSYKDLVIEKYMPNVFKEAIIEKSVVIPNGIDDFWFKNKYATERKITTKDINLISVGEINSNKNVLSTAKACEYLINEGYNITLTVIGKVEDNKYFNKLKTFNFIRFIPHINKEKLLFYYRKADIYVMPSKRETFGLVYAEAMSQGLPIIYTKGQGFDTQFSEGEVGYSVKSNDYIELAEKIKLIGNNYNLFSTKASKNVGRFNWDKLSDMYINCYSII